MNVPRIIKILACALLACQISQVNADVRISTKLGDQPLDWIISGKFKPGETFYGKNISLLNNNVSEDQIFYFRHTYDLSLQAVYGKGACDATIVEVMASARNKAIWGNSASIAPVTDSPIKIVSSVGESHTHYLARQIMWLRELWLRASLGDVLSLSFANPQYFTLGAFSFNLGRGISLGDAYAVSADYLGFYADSAVDQYAFGFKFSGDLIKKKLLYELYGGLLNNLCSSLSQTGLRILEQEYGRRNSPGRGFGKISYVLAGHLLWTPVKTDCSSWAFEPYFMYNNDPEQRVEFPADAESKLGTFGFAGEIVNDRVEFGFDTAVNVGRQHVKGWDRNTITQQNRNGILTFVNSHVVVNVDPKNPGMVTDFGPYLAVQSAITIKDQDINSSGRRAQSIINNAIQNQNQNGLLIGTAPAGMVNGYAVSVNAPNPVAPATDGQLYNVADRFRNPYDNVYKGWMLVADAAVLSPKKDFKLAGAVGVASGDADPNFVEKDGVYSGFVSLQEMYAGKRVRSSFVMGGAGKLRRPLSVPDEVEDPDADFGALTSNFTNLIFVGSGFTWEPREWKKRFSINPNILAYWMYKADKKFDILTKETTDENASRYLGIEANVFIDKELAKNFKGFLIVSWFAPGTYYKDVRGKPLNASQRRALDAFDAGDDEDAPYPGLSNSKAWALQAGVEYKF